MYYCIHILYHSVLCQIAFQHKKSFLIKICITFGRVTKLFIIVFLYHSKPLFLSHRTTLYDITTWFSYYITLDCFVSYYVSLCIIISHHLIFYPIVLVHITFCFVASYCIVKYRIIIFHKKSNHVTLCSIISHYTESCHTVAVKLQCKVLKYICCITLLENNKVFQIK